MFGVFRSCLKGLLLGLGRLSRGNRKGGPDDEN